MSYVLDTNIVAAALNGVRVVVNRLNQIEPGEAFLPAMVLAELRYGARSSQRVAENLARIERVSEILIFVSVNRPIAERFGDLKASQRQRGLTKSDADLLIAATALETQSVLVTNDRALHDGSIENLSVESWL